MQNKRAIFGAKGLPYLLLAPQLIITAIFFLWPAGQAIWQSFLREDAFGIKTTFVALENYRYLFHDPSYLNSLKVTVVFALSTAALSMGAALILALAVDRMLRSARLYSTLLIWPYAVAPAIAGVLWWFMFNPTIGILPYLLEAVGYKWNHALDRGNAMTLVVIASAWKQISYNFLFFVAGLQAIPGSLREAAAIDGAGPVRRFWTITLPLLSPTTFFLLVVTIVYTMFDTFGVIDAITEGGPAQSTNILVYKVYQDGFVGLNLGSSAAQSVVLMGIVILLTVIQFRFVERRVNY
ncbi:sn-glycerol-3-phosphate ABC transporter permease UgpA [Pseudooceanicola spongiae]|jgi:sn-glycerol 3-phosphate transport system permease protein|uniref:sn-glycerol-3-phosphate transport system permease protein UgpA n=1 Tax=Pseudooceanicola spongiae TaxID=2613965 RepID=A0A7L9WR16_9RHOB|nr:sn-glycerol-3-phosphate ABC transporter permease UgpA [Pseudooceanicola spongiae]QOL82284.1 sn-glycerol-3-phosphate ABC transporter permease UgpA [Pseudooceanicola spongiae]